MGLIDRIRRLRLRPVTAAGVGFGRQLPWAAIGLGAGGILGLIAVVLVTAWLFGPRKPAPSTSQVVAGVPLAQAPERAGKPAADPAAAAPVRPGLGLQIPATSAEAFDVVAPATVVEALSEAPDPALLEAVNGQMLPRIGADGHRPWNVYARPFDRKDDRPRVALIIGGLGLSRAATEAAIDRLPGAVSLAFDSYAEEVTTWTRRARRNGHETLATLPLQAADFPFRDLGPQSLQATAAPATNMQRLNDVLAGAPGAVGLLGIGGSAFNRSIEAATPILKVIRSRGLLLADATALAGPSLMALAAKLDVPSLQVDVMLDDVPEAAAIDQQLQRLVEIARERLVSVGLGRPLPLTFARIQAWAGRLDAAGIVLAPASAIVGTQFASP